MKRIDVLLVEDESLIRQGIRSLLEKEDFVDKIYEAGNAAQFFEQLSLHPVDIILLDIKLPGIRGLEILTEITKKPDHPRVIAVTALEGVELIINLLKSGISGIVFKLDGYSEIVKTIEEVVGNGHYFQEKVTKIIQANSHRWDKVPTVTLSFHETELLRIIANGLTTKEISVQLKMTEATTETYRTRLIRKLGVSNSAALLAYAFRNGIL